MNHAAESTCHLPAGGEIRVRVELLTMDVQGHAYVAGLKGGEVHPILSQAAQEAATAILVLAEQDTKRIRD